MKILIADDHELFLNGLEFVLGTEFKDAKIVTAKSYTEIFERLKKETDFDLIVTDLAMPGSNWIEALDKMQQEYPEYHYGMYDGCYSVEPVNADVLSEATDPHDLVELEYPSLTVTLYGEKRDADDWDEVEHTDRYVFLVPKVDVAVAIWENWITDADVTDVPGGLETLEDDIAWEKFLETHFDILFEKYNKQILEYFREEAEEDFRERSQEEYTMNQWSASADRAYDAYRDSALLGEAYSPNSTVDFEYNDLEVTLQGPKKDVDVWDELDTIVEYTYTKSAEDVAIDLWENFITDYDVKDVPGGLEALEDDAEWEKFLQKRSTDRATRLQHL